MLIDRNTNVNCDFFSDPSNLNRKRDFNRVGQRIARLLAAEEKDRHWKSLTDPARLYPSFLWLGVKSRIEDRLYLLHKFIFGWTFATVSTEQLFKHRFLDPMMPLERMVVGESMEAAKKNTQDILFGDLKDTMRDRKTKRKNTTTKKNKNVVKDEEVTAEITTTPP